MKSKVELQAYIDTFINNYNNAFFEEKDRELLIKKPCVMLSVSSKKGLMNQFIEQFDINKKMLDYVPQNIINNESINIIIKAALSEPEYQEKDIIIHASNMFVNAETKIGDIISEYVKYFKEKLKQIPEEETQEAEVIALKKESDKEHTEIEYKGKFYDVTPSHQVFRKDGTAIKNGAYKNAIIKLYKNL